MLEEWNRTERPILRRDRCIHELFEAQAARTPDAVAARLRRETLTLRASWTRAPNRLAHHLRGAGRRARGARWGSAWSAARDGGRRSWPCSRRAAPTSRWTRPTRPSGWRSCWPTAALRWCWPRRTRAAALLAGATGRIVRRAGRTRTRGDRGGAAERRGRPPPGEPGVRHLHLRLDRAAQGVLVQHRAALANLVAAAQRRRVRRDRPGAPVRGASLRRERRGDLSHAGYGGHAGAAPRRYAGVAAGQFLRSCADLRLSVLDLPTAFWHEVVHGLSTGEGRAPDCVRTVIIGGEAALPDRIDGWRRHAPGVRLFNTYGPTEATVVACSSHRVGEGGAGRNLIGGPFSNTAFYVVDGIDHVERGVRERPPDQVPPRPALAHPVRRARDRGLRGPVRHQHVRVRKGLAQLRPQPGADDVPPRADQPHPRQPRRVRRADTAASCRISAGTTYSAVAPSSASTSAGGSIACSRGTIRTSPPVARGTSAW